MGDTDTAQFGVIRVHRVTDNRVGIGAEAGRARNN